MTTPDSFQSLIEKLDAGAPLPAVGVGDLKRLWVEGNYAKLGQGRQMAHGAGATTFRQTISPGTDLNALQMRALMLAAFFKNGDLGPWQHGDELDDVVFRVAATFALDTNRNDFPGFAIIEQLRKEDTSRTSSP
jgi:hypothetical protein